MFKIVIFCFLYSVFAISCAQRKCDNLGILFYEDMACKPLNIDKSTGCPTEFDCPYLKRTKNRCFYKNKFYKVGDSVPNFDLSCKMGCSCQEYVFSCDENGDIFCGIFIDCAEFFGIPPSEGCYRTYDLKRCCSVGENCEKMPFQCEFESNTYKEGERFVPQHSCSICLCQKGFNGKIESQFCIPRPCSVELAYNKKTEKCAPLYRSDRDLKNGIFCCHDGWVCQNGSEQVFGCPTSDKQCFFGNITMKVGQKIKKDADSQIPENVICECKVPPLLTCVPEFISLIL